MFSLIVAGTARVSTAAPSRDGAGDTPAKECTSEGACSWRSAQDVFHEWSLDGRDSKMAAGHEKAVQEILAEAIPTMTVGKDGFTAIDAGCGNGWVARKIKTLPQCKDAMGVDGAPGMIQRAKEIDPEGKYEVVDLSSWDPEEPVDLVHSMEVLYYLGDDLETVLERIQTRWLKPGGVLAAGVDFYAENKESLTWPGIYNMHMRSLGEKEWKKILEDSGFENVKIWRAARSSKSEPGTLAMTAIKPRG